MFSCSDKCLFPKFFELNADTQNSKYNTKLGVYKEHCGKSRSIWLL
jgi:inositol oxygenase